MSSGATMHRPVWQMPEGGLKEHERQKFWEYVKRDMHHWVWTGPATTRPIFPLRGVQVAAVRVAWALAHPGEFIPLKLFRVCEVMECISPECYRGKKVNKLEHDETPVDHGGLPGVTRTLEAMAALQFGLPVTPRPIRRLVVPEAEIINAKEGVVQFTIPAETRAINPNETEIALQEHELTLELVLDVLRQPNTVVMTFKTGHTYISTPGVKVDAYTPEDALQAILRSTGKVQCKA